MKLTFGEWENFCKELADNGIISSTARSILERAVNSSSRVKSFVNIKHDVESQPYKALILAQIEAKYGHMSTYYIQSSLMDEKNIPIFTEIKNLGHEVSYHFEVMDLAKGDLMQALKIYENEIIRFKSLGFDIVTVCQHGNPVSEYENRDFFKSKLVQGKFPHQADIMVNFMSKIGQEYIYISDAGMTFKEIFDPHLPYSDTKEIGDTYRVLNLLLDNPDASYIISSHPHRYNKNYYIAMLRKVFFKIARFFAKPLLRIPWLRKFVFKHSTITKYI